MSHQNREYLEAKVQTANSAQLHLMLIDGALRFGREAEKGVLRRDEVAYQPPLMRAMDIVGELLAGVRHNKTDLNAKLAQLYAFVYARMTSAYVNADKAAMAEALQVLEIERETWRQAVEKLGAEQAAQPGVQSRKKPAPKPHLGSAPAATPATGLSLEA
ncbi:Flagellar protein FliS [Planctomycetes bacterium MalM25]|nr:Flagellar protein FliS [Planctomycetes bacterium MalM25]